MAHHEGVVDVTAAGGITVKDLLAEPLLRDSLVSNESGLGNVVTWCLPLSELVERGNLPQHPVKDLNGIAVHLPSRHLVGGDDAQRLVEHLAAAGAAVLMAWSRPGEPVPQLNRAIAAANATRVPLLALGPEADYRRASLLVVTKSLAQSTHVLEYSTYVHEEIADVLARGTGLAAMARTMANLAGTSVMILGTDHELLAHADAIVPGADVIDVLSDHAAIVPVAADFLSGLTSSHGSAPSGRSVHKASTELGTGPATLLIAPVMLAGELLGSVVLIERSPVGESHRQVQQTIVAGEGATLTGSELLRQKSVRRAEEKARNDFIYALLYGRFTDQLELAARSRYYKFLPDGRYAVLVVVGPRGNGQLQGEDMRAAAGRAIAASHPATDAAQVLTGQIGSMIIVLRQLAPLTPQADDVLTERAVLRSFAGQISRIARSLLGDGVRVAYGRADNGAAGVSRSYREARIALALGEGADESGVYPYDVLRVYAAIQEVAQSPSGRSFAAEVLQPLQQADGQTGDLRQIVLAYIEESGNVNAAARRLHLHRNTMLYKLNRASRALRMDIRKSETQFMVWLACRIETLSEVQNDFEDELTLPS